MGADELPGDMAASEGRATDRRTFVGSVIWASTGGVLAMNAALPAGLAGAAPVGPTGPAVGAGGLLPATGADQLTKSAVGLAAMATGAGLWWLSQRRSAPPATEPSD